VRWRDSTFLLIPHTHTHTHTHTQKRARHRTSHTTTTQHTLVSSLLLILFPPSSSLFSLSLSLSLSLTEHQELIYLRPPLPKSLFSLFQLQALPPSIIVVYSLLLFLLLSLLIANTLQPCSGSDSIHTHSVGVCFFTRQHTCATCTCLIAL
jgi:hypothetical protein